MHLQQTKRDSIASGGPQYYFHDLSDPVLTYLRSRGAVRVALVTPYGGTKSDFFAVGKDHKLEGHDGEVVPGRVGHDRIQQGRASASIGEAIRHWYRLNTGNFERIDVDVQIVDDIFYVRPLRCKYASRPRTVDLPVIERPLTFTSIIKVLSGASRSNLSTEISHCGLSKKSAELQRTTGPARNSRISKKRTSCVLRDHSVT